MTRPERAVRADAAEILALYRAAAKAANQSGRSHWDEDYPNTETIREDIENGCLYVCLLYTSTPSARTRKATKCA